MALRELSGHCWELQAGVKKFGFFFFYGFFVLLLVSSMRGKDRRDDILFWGICGVPLWHRWRRGAW